MSNRHLARSVAMQCLYQWDFKGRPTAAIPAIIDQTMEEFGDGLDQDADFVTKTVNGVLDNQEKIDGVIAQYATNWPLDALTLVDRNVLRIGIFELLFNEEIPAKVAINEAIEIAKNYGGPTSGKFVNGILGALYKDIVSLQEKPA